MAKFSFFPFSFNKTVKCTSSDTVSMDDPAFAQMDPHLKVDDTSDFEGPEPMVNKFPLKPPSFEGLFNNVKAVTKKYEIIKGFRFELSGAVSNNFHVSHIWSIPHKTIIPQKRTLKQGTYTLTTQYLSGEIKTFFDQPKFILTGRLESSGKLETGIIKKINENWTARLSSAYPGEPMIPPQMHLDFDHENKDSVSNFKLGSGFLAFNTMQSIGRNLVLGFEVFNIHMVDKLNQGEKRTEFSYAARYKRENHFLSAQYMAMQTSVNLAYSMFVKMNNSVEI